jgi:hypothetical protein
MGRVSFFRFDSMSSPEITKSDFMSVVGRLVNLAIRSHVMYNVKKYCISIRRFDRTFDVISLISGQIMYSLSLVEFC